MGNTLIVAEIAQGFEGQPGLCKSFIKLAKESAADAVKFQIFKADELCIENYEHYELFKSLEINYEIWNDLVDYARKIGVAFYADIFGFNTLAWAKEKNIEGIKIHSTDVKNYPLMKSIPGYKGVVLVSTGGCEMSEIERAVEILKDTDLVLLNGFQAEPNHLQDVELDKLDLLKSKFGKKVGFADHIDVNNPMSISLPAIAVSRGVDCIEKHLTIERDYLQLEDNISALNPSEFRQMVGLIRDVEELPKTGESYILLEREADYRSRTKKVPLFAGNFSKGHVLKDDDISLLRTSEKVDVILDVDDLIGKKLIQDVKENSAIFKESLEWD